MALDEAQRGNAAALKILLEAGKYAKPELNQALRLAIRDANSMECVELLLAVGAEVNVPDRDGYTAFSMAAGVSSGDINDKSNTKSLSNIYNI
ncbi:MAG: ankyrin repeat domain-containing protein [Victivallales bacterium]